MIFAIVERLAHNFVHKICAKLLMLLLAGGGEAVLQCANARQRLPHRPLHAYNHGQALVSSDSSAFQCK